MNLNFKEKTVLVTAGSKGIGYELAKQFLILNAIDFFFLFSDIYFKYKLNNY